MKKTLITKIALVVASALSLVFLALAYVEGVSGYDLLSNVNAAFQFGDFATILIYLAPLFILIAAIVLFIFSILALLGELNVIKNEKLLKVSAKINFIVCIVLCAVALVGFVVALIKGYEVSVGSILLLIIAVGVILFMKTFLQSFCWYTYIS